MKAVYAAHPAPADPLSALRFGPRPEPAPPTAGWRAVTVRCAALNHHDLWTLRGAGVPASRYPIILGSDAAGTDTSGMPVIVHGMVYAREFASHPVRDPQRGILGESWPGTFAERVVVPAHTLAPKPPQFSFAQAAALCGTWLTAYRMLFTKAEAAQEQTILVQGAGGGLAAALIELAAAAGARVWATSRTERGRAFAMSLGAAQAFPAGARLPEPVDAVMDSVGQATWAHSLRNLRPGGTLVIAGATSGSLPDAHLTRIFWNELRVLGAMSGTMTELRELVSFMLAHGLRPRIHGEFQMHEAAEAFRVLSEGGALGKVILRW